MSLPSECQTGVHFQNVALLDQSSQRIVHWVVAHELASGCAVRPETGPMYGPGAVGELALATRLLPRLPAHSVLLADRNFGVFAFAYAAFRLAERRMISCGPHFPPAR